MKLPKRGTSSFSWLQAGFLVYTLAPQGNHRSNRPQSRGCIYGNSSVRLCSWQTFRRWPMASGINSMKSAVCSAATLVLLLSIFFSSPLHGQVVGGTISGRVTDSSAAAIPSAKVTIRNIATGVTTTITTNAQGIFHAPNLLPGDYEARISALGF